MAKQVSKSADTPAHVLSSIALETTSALEAAPALEAAQEVKPALEAAQEVKPALEAAQEVKPALEPTQEVKPDPLALLIDAARVSGVSIAELVKGLASLASPSASSTPSAAPRASVSAYVKNPNAFRNSKLNLALRLTFVAPNPKRPGTAAHARYSAYPVGDGTWTLGAILKELPYGPNTADFLYDIRAGFIKVAE